MLSSRRSFLTSLPAFGLAPRTSAPIVMTVRGPLIPAAMGVTLPHEHILVNFQPLAERAHNPLSWQPREVISVALPHLRRIRRLGCRTLVDATPIALGRDPLLLRSLSKASGLHIITPTGNYAARSGVFLPPYVSSDSPESLAARWIAEFRHGIDSTGVRPGFIKLGFQGGPLSPMERKLILAAALAHLDTGLTIASHTGPAVSALEQLAILDSAQVSPSAWIWVHAQAERDPAPLLEAARRGAWISLDGLAPQSLPLHLHHASALRDAGLLSRLLLSHDAGWYHVGEPRGGSFRPFDTAFTHFQPAARAAGWSSADLDTLFSTNPAAAFSIRPRPA